MAKKTLKKTVTEETAKKSTEYDGVFIGDNEIEKLAETVGEVDDIPSLTVEDDIVVDENVKSAPMQSENNIKNTKAKFAKDYHCVVGGEYYEFKKGRTYTIPTNVKMVVAKANGVLDPM